MYMEFLLLVCYVSCYDNKRASLEIRKRFNPARKLSTNEPTKLGNHLEERGKKNIQLVVFAREASGKRGSSFDTLFYNFSSCFVPLN